MPRVGREETRGPSAPRTNRAALSTVADARETIIQRREKNQAKLNAIFDDINPDQSPLAYGIKARVQDDEFLVGLIDGLVHAIAELEKRGGS